MKMQKCGHDNCFTCPYYDCIIKDADIRLDDEIDDVIRGQRGKSRPKADRAERLRRKREYQKKWYAEHKEEHKAKMREYNRKRRGVAV